MEKVDMVVESRVNVEDAWLNLNASEAALKESTKVKPRRKSTFGWSPEARVKKYRKLLELALSDQERTLNEFDGYISGQIGKGRKGDDGFLLERFINLGKEVTELHQRVKKAKSLEERSSLLKEFDKALEERAGIYTAIKEGRGEIPAFKASSGVPIESAARWTKKVELRTTWPVAGVVGRKTSLVEVSFDKGKTWERFVKIESNPDGMTQTYKELWEEKAIVAPQIWKIEGGILMTDLGWPERQEVKDLEYIRLRWENRGKSEESIPGWLKDEKEKIIKKLVRNAEAAAFAGYKADAGSHFLARD